MGGGAISIAEILNKYNAPQANERVGIFAALSMKFKSNIQRKVKYIDVADLIKNHKDAMYTYISNRKYLTYTLQKFLKSIFCCIICKSNKKLRSELHNRENFLMIKGE